MDFRRIDTNTPEVQERETQSSEFLPSFVLLYICKRMEKKLDGNYTRMQRGILNKSWR